MTTTASSQRKREDWETLASEILPSIQEHGGITPELRKKHDIGYLYRLQIALAKQGYDIHGKPIQVKPIQAKRPDAVAKQIAERRQKGEPFWLLEVASGMTHTQMAKLLGEHGHSMSKATNGSHS